MVSTSFDNGTTLTNGTDCLNPVHVFESFVTLWECFSFFSDGNDGYFRGSYSPTLQLPMNSTLAAVVMDCIDQYCQAPNPELGGCQRDVSSPDYLELGFSPIASFQNQACGGIMDEVNADIGGVGVFVSYLMQIGIVIYIWFAVRLIGWLPGICRGFMNLSARLAGLGSPTKEAEIRQRAKWFQADFRKRLERHLSVLKFTMVEFQEAQCFFMLAVQVAILAALDAGPQVFQATNMEQLRTNISVSRAVSLAGALPIVFGLWCMYTSHMNSWYAFAFSTVTFAISNANFNMSKQAPDTTNLAPVSDTEKLDKCGGHPPPLIYCGVSWWSVSSPAFYIPIINITALVLYGVLLLLQVGPYIPRLLHNAGWFQQVHCRAKRMRSARWFRITLKILIALVELTLLIFSLAFGTFLSLQSMSVLDFQAWSFGQIIAVTIWAPVISKYLYWAVFGTKSYSQIRVPLPYKIVKTSETHNAKWSPMADDGVFFPLSSTENLVSAQSSKNMVVEMNLLRGETLTELGPNSSRRGSDGTAKRKSTFGEVPE